MAELNNEKQNKAWQVAREYGLQDMDEVLHNISPAKLYEEALRYEKGSAISSTGAIVVESGSHKGRSPKDKRIVRHKDSEHDIWWGNINIPMEEHVFMINQERAIDFLNSRKRIYIVDGYASWDTRYRLKIRTICSRAYHALFMHNMLIRPTEEELRSFGKPDFVIFNGGRFPANRYTSGMTSATSIDVYFERAEMVILGTEYAGEMKKGVFSIMNFLMPRQGVLSLHCSANTDKDNNTVLFFGLSGTGKTTLAIDHNRILIGDDEHCWTDRGIFNIEGGCYAKCIDAPPEILESIYFGAVLENVVYNEQTRVVDYSNNSLTENTRAAYPVEHVPGAKIPATGEHPRHIIFLTCDAFGVLPPVSKLNIEQAMYHFVNGYTAKIAGTEEGITEPQATFSACFGAAFLPLHPVRYADLLSERLKKHKTRVWLVNTGWTGGGYGVGKRMDLKITRAIVRAIYSDALNDTATRAEPYFGLEIPVECPNVNNKLLFPEQTWENTADYRKQALNLIERFKQNIHSFTDKGTEYILKGGPIA